MFGHHDISAFLPDIHNARMCQEDNGNEPPDKISAVILM